MKFLILDTKQTNNFNDPDIQAKIMSLWQDNMTAVKKVGEAGLVTACVYHQYASDYKGDYAVSLCIENDVTGTFDTAKYSWKEYEVDGSDELGIINTWRKIWDDEEKHLINRVYDFDFEQYKPNGEKSIFVAIQ